MSPRWGTGVRTMINEVEMEQLVQSVWSRNVDMISGCQP
jgi:hypothetical protein